MNKIILSVKNLYAGYYVNSKYQQVLKNINLDILTIGQYIRPSKQHLEVVKYYTPSEFEELKHLAENEGIKIVISHPLVRSSYKAFEAFKETVSN